MFEMGVAFLLVFSRYFCYNKGNKFVKVTHIMDYMHLLVGRPTQKSKKLEVCYILGDTTYVRPKRLKEDAKVDFIDWPDTVLGRLQRAYDRVPLKQDRDNVLTDYRKLVACLKDAFIALTDGSYESSELFDETCPDSELRRVFLASLEVFEISNTVLRLKTNDVWDLLEDLEASVHKIPDKVIFNRLQERYLDKGFSVFALPESLIGHDYGMIQEGSEIYKTLLFDLIHPFDATFLVNTSLTVLANIKHGDFKSETIAGQLLNVLGDWLRHFDLITEQQITVHEQSKDERVRSYKTMFEKFQAYGGLNGVSLHLFNDVKLSSVGLEEIKDGLLNPLVRMRIDDRATVDSIADSLLSEIDSLSAEITVTPFERKMSLIDTSLVSLKTASSECVSDVAELSDSVDFEVVELSGIRMSDGYWNYSEALLSEVAVDDPVKPVLDGDSEITYVKQSIADLDEPEISGVHIADGSEPPVFTWSADNREFRELSSSEQSEDYAVEKSCFETVPDVLMIDNKISKKDTFYVEPQVVSNDDIPELDRAKKDTFYVESQKSPIDYWHGQPLIVTDKKPGFYTTGLEIALDNLPPKDVLKNVYVDYGPLCAAVQLCLMQDFFDIRVITDELLTVFNDIGRGDYALYDDLCHEKITFLRSGLIRCLLEIKGNVVSPLWDNQTDDQFGFNVKTVQRVLNNLSNTYGRNEGTIEHWFTVSDETKGLIKQALDYVSNDTMFVKVPVSLKHTEFSNWLSPNECDTLSQLLFFDAKKTDWYRSKAIEKELMGQYKDCSLLPLDFLKDDTVTNPSRYRKNKIEAWDFTIQSLLPHPLATVAEYVIRYPYKGGREDLEKAIAWAKKAETSCSYLKATVGYGDSVVDDLPKVTKELFPDCSEGQRDVLRAVQKATLALRGSLGYGEPEEALKEVTAKVTKLLEEL